MPYRFPRSDIRTPPNWDWIEFVDGYPAQVHGIVAEKTPNGEVYRIRLLPHPALAKAYKIPLESLDENQMIEKEYPIDSIILLNPDPIWTRWFCLLTYDGKPSTATDFFKGIAQIENIQRLKEQLQKLRSENAALKEEIHIIRTNLPKYFKQYIQPAVEGMAPIFQKMIISGMEAGEK